MKIAIIADPHIGDYAYSKTDSETGLDTRLLDTLNNLEYSINYSIENDVKLYIIIGDIYRVKNPNSKIRRQFAKRIKKLVKNNIEVILMTGNHDMTTSSDGAHALSEAQEFSGLIDDFAVYSKPIIISRNNKNGDATELYILPFVNRSAEQLLTASDFNNFQKEKIKEFNVMTKKNKAKYKLFFGHFGTDKSVLGNSFDLDMSDDDEHVIKLSDFDEGDWTKIYLGHIHKCQDLNKIAKHVGSLSRVDFSEEDEQKGFYIYEDGQDEFIPVKDRTFKTFRMTITKDCDYVKEIQSLMKKIQSCDLSDVITRVKVDISQTRLSTVKFEIIESYLKKNSWYSCGVDLNVLQDEEIVNEQKITSVDLPNEALKKFIEKHPDRFSGIEDAALTSGIEILKRIKE